MQNNMGRIWSLLAFKLDQPFHNRPVTARLTEQIVEQGRFSQGARKQLFSRMLLAQYLSDEGFELKRELALRPKLGMFLWLRIDWIQQIHTAIGTLG